MAPELQRLTALARGLAPSFKMRVEARWGSQNQDHRRHLRAEIHKALALSEDISDLSRPPRSASHSISISHTIALGGWVSVSRPWQVGFDIESTARITEALITRMATANEIASSPRHELLWGAKESLFKALAEQQPRTASQVQIGPWKDLGAGCFYFEGLGGGHGYICASPLYIYSVCLYKGSVSF